jgi:hypothetical protein
MTTIASTPANTPSSFVSTRLDEDAHRRSILLPGLDPEVFLMGLIVLALNLFMVYIVVFEVGFFQPDATSRTRAVWQVFYSNDPKLSNVGFVWTPLPAFLQLPLVLIPGLLHKGLSGNIVTALTGTGAALVLLVFLRRVKLDVVMRWLVVATFVLNPFVWFYSANAMSEITFGFFTMMAAYYYWRWSESKGRWMYLTGCSLSTAGAFLSRYEGVILIVVFGALVAWQAFLWHYRNPNYIESAILLYGAPVTYVVSLWLLACYLIVGDPLYFARGPYSNAARIGYQLAGTPWLIPLKGNLLGSLETVLTEAWQIFPPFIFLSVILFLLAVVRRSWVWVYILGVAWSFMAFMMFNIYAGQTMMFVRYFATSELPMAFIIGVGIVQLVPRGRALVGLVLSISFALSGFYTFDKLLNATRPGEWNDVFFRALVSGKRAYNYDLDTYEKMGKYIVTKTSGKVLVDDSQGTNIIFFSEEPWRFIVPGDSFFFRALYEPANYVDYVLVSQSFEIGEGTLNLVNRYYPKLHAEGASWAKLEREEGEWRLYKIIRPPKGSVPHLDSLD